jgi:hypothetical protein
MSASVQVPASSITAGTTQDFTFAVQTLAPGQAVQVGPVAPLDASWAGLIWIGFVSAVNVLTIRVANVTSGTKNPVAQAFAIQPGRDTSLN